MSAWSDVLRRAFEQRLNAGLDEIPLNVVLLARAVESLDPGKLEPVGGWFEYKGRRLTLAHGTLQPLVGIPGVLFQTLTEPAGVSFQLSARNVPAALFGTGALPASLIGAANVEYLKGLRALWRNVGALGAVDVAPFVKVIDAGIVVMPASGARLATVQRDAVPPTVGGWPLIVEQFEPAARAYATRNLEAAATAARVASENADAWAKIEDVVRMVRDLPANAATGAVKALAGAIGPKNALLIGAVLLGVGGFLFWRGRRGH